VKRAAAWTLAALVLLVVVLTALVGALNFRGEQPIPEATTHFRPTAEQVKRGEYLVRAGNCIACHTARGGAPYAGGVGVRTPFGTVYSSNITPDAKTGIGRWSAAHFWRALHNGRSRDGRLLYPAFPYTEYTLVTRADSDAMFAYLLSLPPVEQVRRPHELRFPYDSQAALAVWRALFFEPGVYVNDPAQPEQWNRGAYLVRGVGHCAACHGGRNAFGATTNRLELSGGVIPMQGWYAPSLSSSREAGVADWDAQHVVQLLKTGVAPRGSVMGPMAEVVFRSTQYLTDDDLRAMALFLKQLPETETARAATTVLDGETRTRGGRVYEDHCARCHGKQGEGTPGAYPALAKNRAVTMNSTANVIRVVLSGGYLPATSANPRPYGMPPFAPLLDDAQVAAVLSYIRASWGNDAQPVLQREVMRYRTGAVQ
jgi:mono/diheme cytochrome c family protein